MEIPFVTLLHNFVILMHGVLLNEKTDKFLLENMNVLMKLLIKIVLKDVLRTVSVYSMQARCNRGGGLRG